MLNLLSVPVLSDRVGVLRFLWLSAGYPACARFMVSCRRCFKRMSGRKFICNFAQQLHFLQFGDGPELQRRFHDPGSPGITNTMVRAGAKMFYQSPFRQLPLQAFRVIPQCVVFHSADQLLQKGMLLWCVNREKLHENRDAGEQIAWKCDLPVNQNALCITCWPRLCNF